MYAIGNKIVDQDTLFEKYLNAQDLPLHQKLFLDDEGSSEEGSELNDQPTEEYKRKK